MHVKPVFNFMNYPFFNDDIDFNWPTQQLKIAHLVNESRIKEKEMELSNFFVNNEQYLIRREKSHSKQLRRISEEISKLRFEVIYLEKDLSDIEEKKRNVILSTKIESSKIINLIQIDIENENQRITELQKKIEQQRNDYLNKINEEKKEKANILNDYDQVISDLWQEIKQTEIQLFSSSKKSLKNTNKKFQSTQSSTESTSLHSPQIFYDYKEFLEMQSAGSFLSSEIDDVQRSIQNIQSKIEKETNNMEELEFRLKEAENISTDYRKEISYLHERHHEIKDKFDEISISQWNQKESTILIDS